MLKKKMMRDILAVFSNELRSNRAFKGKNDLAIALGDVLKAMISMYVWLKEMEVTKTLREHRLKP